MTNALSMALFFVPATALRRPSGALQPRLRAQADPEIL